MTEYTKTRLPELGLHFGLDDQRTGCEPLLVNSAALETAIDPYRHNHGIATDPVKLAQHCQTMFGAVKVLKQLHAKNAVNRILRQADAER